MTTSTQKPLNTGLFLLLFGSSALFWGLSFIMTSILLETFTPVQILAQRWLLAALFFMIMVATGKLKLGYKGQAPKWLLLTVILMPCIYCLLETYGVALTNASIASVFTATMPCCALILGAVLFHRRTSRRGLLGIFLAFGGVIVVTVFAPDFSAEGRWLGYLIMVVAIFFASLYTFSSARAGQEFSPLSVTATMAFAGALWFNLLNFALGYGTETYTLLFTDYHLVLGICFLGILCSSVSYIAYNTLLTRTRDIAVTQSVSSSLVTIIGVLGGIFIRGDSWGIYTLIGLAMAIAGVCISSKEV